MKKQTKDKNVYIAVPFIILLSVGFFLASIKINEIARQDGMSVLESAAKQLITEIKSDVETNYNQLIMLADILGRYEDLESKEAAATVCAFNQKGLISMVGMLLPNNSMVMCDASIQYEKDLNFESEADKVPYISDRVTFPVREELSIYQAVPIMREGETVGILYGYLDLEVFSEKYQLVIFDYESAYIIVEGNKGDILADSWHDFLGNIHDDNLSHRQTASETTFEDLHQDISVGKSGHVIFRSEGLGGNYMYAVYMPIGINNWSVMVQAPEEAVLKTAVRIQRVFYGIGIVDIILSLTGIIWILINVRKNAKHKEWELHKTLYIVEIQKTLMGVHTDVNFLEEALKISGNTVAAQKSFLISLGEDGTGSNYIWSKEKGAWQEVLSQEVVRRMMTAFGPEFINQRGVVIEKNRIDGNSEREERILETWNVSNLMMVPIMDKNDKLSAILGIADYEEKKGNIELLECVTPHFYMGMLNYESYCKIKEMGIVDMLTGLQNRNCYQQDVLKLTQQEPHSLCCIYLDVNGLHEMNNKLGHAAGDQMLRTIGKQLKECFGKENAYRIGGDEFVVFCKNMAQTEARDRIGLFQKNIDSHGYSVSIGSIWRDTTIQVDSLIASAEKEMYEDKRRYYEKRGDVKKAREMNWKLEQILLEKKDFENFLSLISHYFLGVYVVNLETDSTRVIYKPSYFDKILNEKNGKFKLAIQEYISIFVGAQHQERLSAFVDYQALEENLRQKVVGHIIYDKQDGTKIRLRVYPAAGFGEQNMDTFWLFEEIVMGH